MPTETVFAPPDTVFDYRSAAKAENIPQAMLHSLESEAACEFPNDPMLMELHVLRAIKARNRRLQTAKA